MKDKINSAPKPASAAQRLLLMLRPGEVVTSTRLRTLGISERVTHYLKKTGAIMSLGVGAYVRGQDKPSFASAIFALTEHLSMPVHIGGRTALRLQGASQYLTLGRGEMAWIFSSKKINLPLWFVNLQSDVSPCLIQTHFLDSNLDGLIRTIEVDGFNVRVSPKERAILEMIFLIGKSHRFEEVDEVFEGLTSLNPNILQELLEKCQSIRVCRVFLYLAHKHKHPWLGAVDESRVSLGSGKRVVVKNGRLDSKYLITVPREEVESDA